MGQIFGRQYGLLEPTAYLSGFLILRFLGSVVYLKVMGRSIFIINDAKYAFDMLAMKSRCFGDRPKFVMGGQLVGWDECPALIPFSETWLEYRRLFSQFMGTKSKVGALQNVLHDETRGYIDSIFKDPQRWAQHSQRFVSPVSHSVVSSFYVLCRKILWRNCP